MVMSTDNRQKVGRLNNKVRLNFWLLTYQDDQLNELCKVTGKTKTAEISNAIAMYISSMKDLGVIS